MSDFIAPILDWLVAAVAAMPAPDGMDAWGQVTKSWTFAPANWPPAAVLPASTDFDPEIQNALHEQHNFTIKFGVQDADPDEITRKAIAYMTAIDGAVQGAAWLPQVRRVFVERHDYGTLWSTRDGSWARFPELHLMVEAYEV
jgi:hypothetical protein